MLVYINDKAQEFEGTTLEELLVAAAVDRMGVAVAVDMEIIPTTEYESFKLTQGAQITIIRATKGG